MKVTTGTITAPVVGGGANQTSAIDLSGTFSASEPMRALLFHVQYRTATGAVDGDIRGCLGMVTNDGGTVQQGYRAVFDGDASLASTTARGIGTTFCLKGFSANATPTVEYTASCTTWSDTGFTLTWATAPAIAIIVSYFAIGGSDVSAARVHTWAVAAGTTNNVTVNTGFGQPDLVFLTHHSNTGTTDATGQFMFSLGVFTKTNVTGRTTEFVDSPAAATMASMHHQVAGIGAVIADGQVVIASTMVASATGSWPTDGYQVTFGTSTSTARTMMGLAIKTTAAMTLGAATNPTSGTTTNIAHNGTVPVGAVFWGGLLAANAGAVTTATDLGGFMLGSWDGTNQSVQGCCQMSGDAVASTGRWYDNTKAVQHYGPVASGTNPPTLRASAACAAAATDGVVLTYTGSDTILRQFNYLLVGTVPPIVDTLTLPMFQGAY